MNGPGDEMICVIILSVKKILFAILLCTTLWAEISISIGQTSGRYLQSIDGDGFQQRYSVLAGRPAIFYELDSLGHPLFLPNDFVAYGIAAFAETRHHEYVAGYQYTTYLPLYANYYYVLNEHWALGAGINFNIMQLRYKNDTLTLGQQLGKNILLRYRIADHFFESGIMQTCAASRFGDTDTFYDATNYIFKIGYYLEKNTF